MPQLLHVWSQYDRYAIALGYLENGMDFFHPQTYSLWKPFCSGCASDYGSPITAVDLPIHEYLMACIMKLSGARSYAICRLYNFFFGALGVWFLFRLTLEVSGSFVRGWFVAAFALFAPVYAHYQFGMIPSIPALATNFMGFYFLFKYARSQHVKEWVIAIVCFTLSAIVRTPQAIFLLSASGFLCVFFLKNKSINWRALGVLSGGILLWGLCYGYKLSLYEEYGSLFLDRPYPAGSSDAFWSIWDKVWSYWWKEYLEEKAWVILGILLVCMIVFHKFVSCSVSGNSVLSLFGRSRRNRVRHAHVESI